MSGLAAFVVPLDEDTYRGRGARADAWQFVLRNLVEYCWPVATGSPRSDVWVKAEAVADAMLRTHSEIVVVHDADVIIHPLAIHSAMQACEAGAPWAVPHGVVHRYDEPSTAALIADEHTPTPNLTRWPYEGIAGGGIVVLHREVYDDCPLDRRFQGWGGEDESWGWALTTLHGRPWRGSSQLVHLWHPHATGLTNPQRPARRESDHLKRMYRAARGDVAAMRDLVDAGRARV